MGEDGQGYAKDSPNRCPRLFTFYHEQKLGCQSLNCELYLVNAFLLLAAD